MVSSIQERYKCFSKYILKKELKPDICRGIRTAPLVLTVFERDVHQTKFIRGAAIKIGACRAWKPRPLY